MSQHCVAFALKVAFGPMCGTTKCNICLLGIPITIFGKADLHTSNCIIILLFITIFWWFLNHNLIWYWLSIAFSSGHGAQLCTQISEFWIFLYIYYILSLHHMKALIASFPTVKSSWDLVELLLRYAKKIVTNTDFRRICYFVGHRKCLQWQCLSRVTHYKMAVTH